MRCCAIPQLLLPCICMSGMLAHGSPVPESDECGTEGHLIGPPSKHTSDA
jgi:hypothetical protein